MLKARRESFLTSSSVPADEIALGRTSRAVLFGGWQPNSNLKARPSPQRVASWSGKPHETAAKWESRPGNNPFHHKKSLRPYCSFPPCRAVDNDGIACPKTTLFSIPSSAPLLLQSSQSLHRSWAHNRQPLQSTHVGKAGTHRPHDSHPRSCLWLSHNEPPR